MGDRLRGQVRDSSARRRRGLRWAIGAMSATLLAAAAIVMTGSSGAGAAQAPGQGNSYAQLLQVAPHEGSLAVGAVLGEALAGHTDTVARAQSQGVDLGAVGTAMQGYNCGQPPQQPIHDAVPQPLETETGAQGADTGQTQSPDKSDYFATEFVKADGTPYGEADTTFAGPVADPSNAFAVSGLHSKSWSGLVNGVNEAGATSDIAQIVLGGGAVELEGLHWSAVDPTGGTPTGSFTIGHVIIGGTELPNTADLSAVNSAVNQALGTLGLQVQLPVASVVQGIEFVSPLEIQVVPNTQRDAVTDPIVTGLQPAFYPITNGLENGFASDPPPFNQLAQIEQGNGAQLAQALCQTDTPITVLDITVAAFDGGGYFTTALGGVNATSSVLPPNTYDLSALGFGSLDQSASGDLSGGSLGTPGDLGGFSPGGAGAAGSTTPGTRSAVPARAVGARRLAGGGSLLAAGLGGLGLLAAMVEADRRKMRVAQRAVTFEE